MKKQFSSVLFALAISACGGDHVAPTVTPPSPAPIAEMPAPVVEPKPITPAPEPVKVVGCAGHRRPPRAAAGSGAGCAHCLITHPPRLAIAPCLVQKITGPVPPA